MAKQHTREELAVKQALPLDVKIKMTETRIKDWVDVLGFHTSGGNHMSKFETMFTILFAIHLLLELAIIGNTNNKNGGGKQ